MISPTSPLITRSLARTVDDMLLDAGEADPALRSALLALGSFRSLPAPEPGAALAELLSGPVDQLARQRFLRRHRTTVVGLAVVAGMGLGVTGVAATGPAPAADATDSIQQMLEDWTPGWTITGKPVAAPEEAGLVVELHPPMDGASGGRSLEDGAAGLTGTSGPGATQTESTGPGASRSGTGQQDSHPSAGTGTGTGNAADGWSSKAGDGGTDGDASDAASKDAGSGDQAGKTGPDAASGQDKAAKSGAVGSAEQQGASLAKTGKTAANDTGPGQVWLNKFNR